MIRPAEEGDAPALAELMTELGYPTAAAEMRLRMQAISSEANFATFVAVEADEVIGMVGVSASVCYEQNERNGRIIALVVRADMRKRGLGRVLVAFAEEYLAKKNVRRIALTSHLKREEAHQFYESLGYARTGWRFVKELPAR